MKPEMLRDATYKGMDTFWVEDATELGFEHIPFPFILLAGGMAVALFINLIEKMPGRRKSVVVGQLLDTPRILKVKMKHG